jgi:hypothetical protein
VELVFQEVVQLFRAIKKPPVRWLLWIDFGFAFPIPRDYGDVGDCITKAKGQWLRAKGRF